MGEETRTGALALIADDDPDILDLVAIRLEQVGCEVVRASDGDRALGLALELCPDICVLDLRMPGRNGWEILDALRGDEATHAIPVVFLTASTDEDVPTARGHTADACFRKPFDAEELKARIKELIVVGSQAAGS